MYELILDVLGVLFLAATHGVIVYNFSSIRIARKTMVVFIGIISLIIWYLGIFMNEKVLLVPVTTLFILVYFSINFKNIHYSLWISVITQIVLALCDALTGLIFVFILRFEYTDITSNKGLYLLLALTIFIIAYLVSYCLGKLSRKLNYVSFIKANIKGTLLITLMIAFVLCLMYSFTVIYKNQASIPSNKLILSYIILVISCAGILAIITYLNDKKIRMALSHIQKEKELEQLKLYTQMLEANTNDLRKFKHDYINILQIIGSYIEADNLIELKNFYKNELMPESQKIIDTDMCFTLLQHIKIDVLKGFLSSKIITAQSKNIKVHIEISDEIAEISIGLLDICRIIGILFDNAIEAAEQCDNGYIDFIVIKNDACITFVIRNSCTKETPPVYKLYEKNFSTKGKGRGIGLKTVREIIDENYTNVYLNTRKNNSCFTQELSIN